MASHGRGIRRSSGSPGNCRRSAIRCCLRAAADLRDIGRRVLAQMEPELGLAGWQTCPTALAFSSPTIFRPPTRLRSTRARWSGSRPLAGGPTSHSAILARTLGIPLGGCGGPEVLAMAPGTRAIVDGDAGAWLDPWTRTLPLGAHGSPPAKPAASRRKPNRRPATTTDGHTIAVAANINRAIQAHCPKAARASA
jgi:phosphocarrier protein FPr